jgi:hypothetical protein
MGPLSEMVLGSVFARRFAYARPEARGLKRTKLASVMAQLSTLKQRPASSCNLDGGNSSILGVLGDDDRKLVEVKGQPLLRRPITER